MTSKAVEQLAQEKKKAAAITRLREEMDYLKKTVANDEDLVLGFCQPSLTSLLKPWQTPIKRLSPDSSYSFTDSAKGMGPVRQLRFNNYACFNTYLHDVGLTIDEFESLTGIGIRDIVKETETFITADTVFCMPCMEFRQWPYAVAATYLDLLVTDTSGDLSLETMQAAWTEAFPYLDHGLVAQLHSAGMLPNEQGAFVRWVFEENEKQRSRMSSKPVDVQIPNTIS